MAKQRRLNKNLVALLTVVGMLLVLAVVTLVVWQQARRDPAELARRAADKAAAGDLQEAAKWYGRAWEASIKRGEPDTQYVVDAAGCWFRLGEFNIWLGLLRKAGADRPDDLDVIVALLNGMWKAHDIVGGPIWADVWRDESDRLLQVLVGAEPEDMLEACAALAPEQRRLALLALSSRAVGLWHTLDAEDDAEGDLAARTAFELDPLDPSTAIAYQEYVDRLARPVFRAARENRRNAVDYAELSEDLRTALALESDTRAWRAIPLTDLAKMIAQRRRAVLRAALAAHPHHSPLARAYAELLQGIAQPLMGDEQARQAAEEGPEELLAEARACLESALAAPSTRPAGSAGDEGEDADLLMALASCRLTQVAYKQREVALADYDDEARAQLLAIDDLARRAAAADPAVYRAYSLRAELVRQFGLKSRGSGRAELPPAGELPSIEQRLDWALDLYEDARQATQTLHNVRATLTAERRLILLRQGLDLALEAYELDRNSDAGALRLGRAEAFVDDARIAQPDDPITHYMLGQFAVAKNDLVAGMQHLVDACEASERSPLAQAIGQWSYWLRYARVGRLPSERLAILYAQAEQFGEAQRYGSLAIEQYKEAKTPPSPQLLDIQSRLLVEVGRPEEGLALLNEYRRVYPDQPGLNAARVKALTALGRTEEAGREAEKITATDVRSRLRKAQMVVRLEDYRQAEEILRGVMSDSARSETECREALRMLMEVLSLDGRRPEARELVQAWKSEPPCENLTQLLAAYDVELSVDDPESLTPEQRAELDRRRLDLINKNPDPLARAQGRYQLYHSRALEAQRKGDGERANAEMEQALSNLAEMRRLRPDDMRVVEEEFRLRLGLKQFDQAVELAALLSQADGGVGFDRAGGATYRGELALARSQPDAAVTEFRAAVQQLPRSAELETKFARACILAGRISEGIEALRQAVESNPRSFEAWYFLRQAYAQRASQSYGEEKAEYERQQAECEAKAEEINPEHPLVLKWKQTAAEEQDPLSAIARREQQWADSPADAENLVRLAELYSAAWKQVSDSGDEQAQSQVSEQAERFFEKAVQQENADLRFTLVRGAALFYATSAQTEKGQAFLRGLIEQESSDSRIALQLTLAGFFETVGDQISADREYQQAQQMVGQVTQDDQQRRRLNVQVGMAMIGFYERQQRPNKVIEACRWVLDQGEGLLSEAAALRQVRLELVDALYRAGFTADAEREIDGYLKLHPDDLFGLSLRAQLHLSKQERGPARVILDRILAIDSTNVFALYARGRLALEQGRYERASEDLTRALAEIGRSPALEVDVRRELTSLYVRQEQYERAETELRGMLDALDRDNAGPEQKQETARRLARVIYIGESDFARAQRLISEYKEKNPEESIWPFELGRLFEARAQKSTDEDHEEDAKADYGLAATYYQQAAELAARSNPLAMMSPTRERLAALVKAGRPAEVLEVYKSLPLEEILRDVQPAYRDQIGARIRTRLGPELAKAYDALHRPDEARTAWQQSLLNACTLDIALAGEVASELRRALDPEDAEQLIRKLVAEVPLDSAPGQRVRIVLATHVALTKDPAAALPILDEVLGKLREGTSERLTAQLTRAQSLEMSGDSAAAVQAYREILSAHPDNTTVLNNLAYLLVSVEPPLFAPAEAMKYAERLRALLVGNPNAATMLDTVGYVYFKNQGEGQQALDLARAVLEEALGLGGPDSAVYLHLGQVYRALGREVDARAALHKGEELARQRDEQDKLQEIQEELAKLR